VFPVVRDVKDGINTAVKAGWCVIAGAAVLSGARRHFPADHHHRRNSRLQTFAGAERNAPGLRVPMPPPAPDLRARPWSVGNAGLRLPKSSTATTTGAALGSRNVSHLGPSL
jgi:hypothetical protein